MKYVDLIIFDLDGTLIDSKEDIAGAVNFFLEELGLRKKSTQEIGSYIGWGVTELIRKSLGKEKKHLFEKALNLFTEYYKKHAVDHTVLYRGVKEILEHFKNKKMVIATNRNHESAKLILETLSIYNYFENIIGGDDAECVKPSSCPLDKILDKLDVDKEKAIIVGDMDLDIYAGKKAGIATCGVTYGIGKKGDVIKAKPDYVIDDIVELKGIIE